MSRDILPIREIDHDLLRRELELDPTGRGYGGLAALWPARCDAMPTLEWQAYCQAVEATAKATHLLLTAKTLLTPQGIISRATQLGLVEVTACDVRRAMELDSRK